MKQQSRLATIAALTLGLSLMAGPAWAAAFNVTNDSGDDIKRACTGSTTLTEVANGASSAFTCTGSAFVQATGDDAAGTVYTITHDCASNETKSTSVSAGTGSEELSLASTCETPSS